MSQLSQLQELISELVDVVKGNLDKKIDLENKIDAFRKIYSIFKKGSKSWKDLIKNFLIS